MALKRAHLRSSIVDAPANKIGGDRGGRSLPGSSKPGGHEDADKGLTGYSAFLKEKLNGIKPDDKTTFSATRRGARRCCISYPMT